MKISKILLFVTLFVLGISLGTQAQFFYGVTGGYNGYKLTGDTYGGMNYLNAPSFGAILGYKLKIDFNLQAEILYIDKGVHQLFTHQQTLTTTEFDTIVTTLDIKKYDNELKLSYLEIPLLIKKSFSLRGGVFPYDRKTGKLDFDIFIGPYFGYRFGSSTKMKVLRTRDITKDGITTPGTETNYDSTSFFMGQNVTITRTDSTYNEDFFSNDVPNYPSISGLNAIDAGITAGIGFSIEVSENSKFTVDGRYSMGLLTIDKTYFNDVDFLFSSFPVTNGVPVTIAANNFYRVERRTKIDLRNTGMGVYVGYIYFLR
ncbi:MAG: PorT family protein [Bacteroidetes bacterium]|nr:PorT family protein [Bacteroidota bacterium]